MKTECSGKHDIWNIASIIDFARDEKNVYVCFVIFRMQFDFIKLSN